MEKTPALFKGKPSNLLRQFTGKLTRELVLEPSGFGLGSMPAGKKPDATTHMVCGYCSTGCSLNIHLKGGQAIGLSPSTNYPVNNGMACPKGWEALTVLDSDDRATQPLLKKNGKFHAVEWAQALDEFADRFKAIQAQHGPQSVAFLSTGQIPTEEMTFLGALAKFGMGMIHGDGNTRQCMATAVVAYKQSFGFDAPPYTYQDFEESDVIVLAGSNMCIAHPIMWERVMNNPYKPDIIVIDPRKTETASAATIHLALAPKSDLVLYYGLAHLLIENDWVDKKYVKEHTKDFKEFAAHVKGFTPEVVSEKSGIPVEQLIDTARRIGQGKRVSLWWTMGINQSYEGVRTAQALINIALMTGNMGRPGTGANSITGQCNAMGSRLFSNTTNMLGGRDFKKKEDREEVADILGIDSGLIPRQESMAYDQILEGIVRGDIRGLWIVATNSAHSWINQPHMIDVLERLDFLVVQDMYHNTETALKADLVLPAAGWGEKEGTFINSERRLGLIKRVKKAPGTALADFFIFKLISHRWGVSELFDKWHTPEDIFQDMKKLSRGKPCDFSGIEDWAHIDRAGGIQWPYPEKRPDNKQQRRLFEDGKYYHADQKARFVFSRPRPLPESCSRQYPLMLLTGRGSASQWHTQTRTSKSAILRKLYPENIYVEINPADAKTYGLKNEMPVEVQSRVGKVHAKAYLTRAVQPGQVFIPMHYAMTNQLTIAEFDPYSRQPSYKASPVIISPAA